MNPVNIQLNAVQLLDNNHNSNQSYFITGPGGSGKTSLLKKIQKIFYVPNIVVVLNKVVNPETFKDDYNGVLFNNVEYPLICNIPHIVVFFDDVVKPETFNDETNVALFTNL